MNEKANQKSNDDLSNAKKDEAAKDSAPLSGEKSVSEDLNGMADADDDLDEEQKKALESIMAEIEGGNKADETEKDAGGDAAASETDEAEDDFAAELEKVAQEAAAATQSEADTKSSDDAEDDLDEEQKKALESIMAQIEGGNKADETEKDTSADAAALETDEAEDDFAAELEKVAQEAAAATQTEAATKPSDDAEDTLDENQQKAFESIMAEIEGKDTDTKPSDADKAPAAAPEKKETAPEKTANVEKDKEDSDVDDISDDIEDILKEITSDIDESDDDGAGERKDAGKKDVVSNDDIIVKDETKDKSEEISPANGDTAVEKTVTEKISTDRKDAPESKTDSEPATQKASPPKKTAPLPKIQKKIRIGKKTAIAVSGFLIISFSLAGYYYKKNLGTPEDETALPASAPAVEQTVQPQPVAAEKSSPPEPVENSSDQYQLKTIGDEIDQLRDELIAKRKEIEELREYYQTGINAELQNLVKTLQETGNSRPITLKTAMADPLVSMGLKAIKRRESYIKKLKDPVNALYYNSEELLYLARKVELLAMMAKHTSDIDIDVFLDQAHLIMTAHRNALSQLNIDDVDVPESDLDSIWQRIESELAQKSNASNPARSTKKSENEAIWAAMCSGNFSQKHKLTALSPEAAQCLANWKGKDLFLNELTTLSPSAARQLADWKGEWLGLNGLKDLSPETAAYLAKWKGKGLSLNGLTRLSPRVVAILSEWQGDQIELINVKHMAHWENPKTRLFLSEEMHRKINGKR